jgi:hypothetical protein
MKDLILAVVVAIGVSVVLLGMAELTVRLIWWIERSLND